MVNFVDDNLEKANNTSKRKLSKIRVTIFVLEISLIAALLVIWLLSDSIQQSKSLWVLFLYSFPSQFLIAPVPHEPVFLYFSKFYAPFAVTLAAISSTILTEVINYSTFKFVVDLKSFERIRYSGIVKKLIESFNRAPFLALWVAAFTPIPFYPFRFLVVLANYPLYKYLLAVFLSRAPRFYLLALFGQKFKIPDYLLVAMFIFIILGSLAPVIKRLIFKKKKIRGFAEELPAEDGSKSYIALPYREEESRTGEAI